MILTALLALTVAPGTVVPPQPAPSPAVLAEIPNLTVSYYDVEGADPRAVRRSMNERRPPDPHTKERFDGRTEIQLQWSIAGGVGRCDPSKAEFTQTVVITLPRLANAGRLSSAERADWTRYMTALIGHERNHALIGLRGEAEAKRRAHSSETCQAVSANVDSVMKAVAAAQVEYDKRTQHGALEGAVYPSGSAASPRRGRSR